MPELKVQALSESRPELDRSIKVHSCNDRDRDYFVEWWLWRINLMVFFLALFVLSGMLGFAETANLVRLLLVMAVCLAAGMWFSLPMPNVHWREFNKAIRHGEVQLIRVVPRMEVKRIDRHIYRHHPETVNGSVAGQSGPPRPCRQTVRRIRRG